MVAPPPPPAPLMVTVADTVPAGGVAVTYPVQFGPDPLQVAATGVVAAPATSLVVATVAHTPAIKTMTTAQVATANGCLRRLDPVTEAGADR